MNLPVLEYLNFVTGMIEKDRDDYYYKQWCAILPLMHMKYIKFISFNDYKDRVTGKDLDLRDTDTIIAEIKELHGME